MLLLKFKHSSFRKGRAIKWKALGITVGLFFPFQQIEGDFENGGIEDNLDRSLLYKVTCPSGTDCLIAVADFVMLENTWVGVMCIPSWVICL